MTNSGFLTGKDLVDIQPMNQPTGQIFYMDFKYSDPMNVPYKTGYGDNRNPHNRDNYAPEGTSWEFNWSYDVYEIEVTPEMVEILRVWRHQLKKWRLPEASDYFQLKLDLKQKGTSFKQLRARAIDVPRFIPKKFEKLINRNFYDVSYVTSPADKIGLINVTV